MQSRRSLSALALALVLAWPMVSLAVEPTSSAAATSAIDASTSFLLQGESAGALAALESVPASDFVGEDAGYRNCVVERFGGSVPVHDTAAATDPFVREVLRTYQTYWWRALATPSQRATSEAELIRTVRSLLGPVAETATDIDTLEPLLQAALLERGHFAQLGRTMPLRELILWRRQESRLFDVVLPEGNHRVRVEQLDDFVSRGWMGYARCSRGSAGGWATADALYAIMPSYHEGLDSEFFQVVFLAHEAQHFADQNAFPDIPPWELEYRAKLTELALAREVSAIRLRGFLTAQSDNPDSPHTYANKRVVADLVARLGRSPDEVDVESLQEAARALLAEDTRRRGGE